MTGRLHFWYNTCYMFIIRVTPLIKGTKLETLSYFSSVEYEIGSFVSVPIRGKNYQAIVAESTLATNSKSTLKKATFSLRKLPQQTNLSSIPKPIKETAQKLTKIYPTSTGSILYQLLPPDVKNGGYHYPTVSSLSHHEETTPQILTATKSERYMAYRTHVRSVLAQRGSVMFVVPNSVDLEYAQKKLSPGIEDRIVKFSPYQNKKERKVAYEAFEDTSLAKVIITTPSHAYLDRVDLLSIIVEQSASNLYRNRTRPYLDHVKALTTYAKVSGRSIILGDILPKTEDEYYRRNEFYITHNQETKRIAFPTPFRVIEQKDKPNSTIPFSLFSPELKRRVNTIIEGRGRVFMYGARRGLAPVVVCIDCCYIFRCPDSHTPFSLIRTYNHEGEEERWFVSSTSGRRVRAADTCHACGSWRLKQRGIGIQHVYDECQNTFPEQKVLLLDNLTASTKRRAQQIIDEFYGSRGVILVGTQLALPHLSAKGVDLSAVISFDAARANPTWRADEDLFRLLLQLREISHKETLIQTRSKPDNLLKLAGQGQLSGFYKDELDLRESLFYPPFSTFILLSWIGDKSAVIETENVIKSIIKTPPAIFYNNPIPQNNRILRHALYRVSLSKEEMARFIDKLRSLPPYIKIEVDPNRIV